MTRLEREASRAGLGTIVTTLAERKPLIIETDPETARRDDFITKDEAVTLEGRARAVKHRHEKIAVTTILAGLEVADFDPALRLS